jgi:hypothetical protein
MRVQHEPRRQGLRYRQARYFLNRLLGMNRRQAALHAGYKELTANNARQVIEGHGLNRASLMRELCQTIEGAEKKGYHDFGEPHFTPEDPSPLELAEPRRTEDPSPLKLAEDLIEALSMPMSASLLCQVSNCIETKARANGISFAAARDQLRVQMQTHPPPDRKWALWLLDGDYGHGPAYRNEAKHERDGNCRPGRRARAVRKNYGPPAARTTGGPGGEKRESSTRL